MKEYAAVESQAQKIIQNRFEASKSQQEWRYEQQFKEASLVNFKYQNVTMSHKIDFIEDMKYLIFDLKRQPQDRALFNNSGWTLAVFTEMEHKTLEHAPPNPTSAAAELFFGEIELEGKVMYKLHHLSYTPIYFNIRSKTVFFYEQLNNQVETYRVDLNQNTLSYTQEIEEYFGLKVKEQLLRIKRNQESKEFIRVIENKVLFLSFRGAYVYRNEVPDFRVEDFLRGDVDIIKSIDFRHQQHLRAINKLPQYRNAVGGFLQLLNKFTRKRKLVSGQITYPQWLKPQLNVLPSLKMSFSTNIFPQKTPLMHLKIKLSQNEAQQFCRVLKYVFPFYKSYLQRSLTVYESGLADEEVRYMMNQLNYPMHTIVLTKNNLSILGLQYVINASSILYHQVIDLSFNSKLLNFTGGNIFKICNINPALKKIILKGCMVLPGKEQEFFENFSTNMCLAELEINYLDTYNDCMIKHLVSYSAQLF